MHRAASVSRILLVDDHDLSVRHALAVLDHPNREIRFALSADDAIKLALSWLPDLVFIDLHLGGVNGIDIIREIRANWLVRVPHPRIIILTADRSHLDRAEIRRLQIDRVLAKPVSGQQLCNCVTTRGHGALEGKGAGGRATELQQMFRTELDKRLPELDRCLIRLDHDRVSGILHQLIASAAITRHAGLESALRALDSKYRSGGSSEEIAFLYQAVLRSAIRCRARGREQS